MFGRRNLFLFFALLALLFALCVLSLYVGYAHLDFSQIFSALFVFDSDESLRTLILDIRLPRLLTGVFVGAMLACAGVTMQCLFRNPLADPSITGVSSGAALGASLSIFFISSSYLSFQFFALIFGLLASFTVWRLGRINSKTSAFSMLLAGIAVNAFCGALVGFTMYTVREAGLKGFIFWTLGSLDGASYSSIFCAGAIGTLSFLILLFNARAFNMLSLGDDSAYHSGANVERLQILAVLCASLMTAAAVALCGIIGFVGLVVPHIVRRFAGADMRSLLPLSALAGACLLVFADIVARLLNPVDNVPIGVITALIGAPFFIFLLRNSKDVRA